MRLEIDGGWVSKVRRRVEKYNFEVGILEDKPHKHAESHGMFEKPKLGSYAGGPVRKTTGKSSDKTIGQIVVDNMKRLRRNFLAEPFQKQGSDLLKFTHSFLRMALEGRKNQNRVKNLLQAVVRNPINRQEYGRNRPFTADAKGFDRHLIDTGQMFRAIKARILSK